MKSIAAVRIAIVGAIVMCGLLNLKVLAAAPILGMMLYTWIGVRGCRRDPERLRALGDQIYFTAYASTIAAFAGMVLRIEYTGKALDQSSDLWMMAALGVLCTVLGLLAMMTLHDLAGAMPPTNGPGGAAVPSEGAAAQAPPALPPEVQAQAIEQLMATCRVAAEAIGDVNGQVRLLKTAFADVTRYAEAMKEAADTLRRSTVELQDVMDAYARTVTVRIEGDRVSIVPVGSERVS